MLVDGQTSSVAGTNAALLAKMEFFGSARQSLLASMVSLELLHLQDWISQDSGGELL